ncbi:hypothetical protein SPFM12_00195 [Salmonella phage SPFM12]|nr:hypothetical protein SPFM12_00195 [Salmonella phage SPFM12]
MCVRWPHYLERHGFDSKVAPQENDPIQPIKKVTSLRLFPGSEDEFFVMQTTSLARRLWEAFFPTPSNLWLESLCLL